MTVLKRHRFKLILGCLVVFVLLHLSNSPDNLLLIQSSLYGPTHTDDVKSKIRDYSVFFDDFEQFDPKSPSLKKNYKTEKAHEKFVTEKEFLFSKEYLENVLDVSQETFDRLKQSHSSYVDDHINKLVNEYKVATFGNLIPSDPEWAKYKSSAGYVLVGGGKYSWLSYLVIRQLRTVGTELPIELFIPSSQEYEKEFCEVLMPKYNVRCNVLNDGLAKNLSERFKIGGFQYKMLAILTSRFENVMYIDSDNFPTKNIDHLFFSQVYKENGLVVWPDFWARTTNPKFYDIAGITVTEKKYYYNDYDKKQAEKANTDLKPLQEYDFSNAYYHTFEGTLSDPTSETGMLLINKTKHLKTMLLSLYYNIYGPDFYYPLLTQGSAGEGDKETFIAAAHALKQPYYQSKAKVQFIGYVQEDNKGFTSKALAHHDPSEFARNSDPDKVSLIFLHLSYPKYYPNWLYDNHDLVYEKSGNHIRMYESIYERVGYDFDLRMLQVFTQGMCPNYYDDATGKSVDGTGTLQSEYMGKYLQYVRDEEKKNLKRCAEVFVPHLRWLRETSKYSKKDESTP